MDFAEKQPKKWINSDLPLRDEAQRRAVKMLGAWHSFGQRFPELFANKNFLDTAVEEAITLCVKFGLFEEAMKAASYREHAGLTTAEVDKVLKVLLLRYTPYSPFGLGDASYDRFTLRSYPPFVELLQAASDDFRSFIQKECL